MPQQVKDFNDFKKALLSDANLQQQFQQNPLNAVEQFEQHNPLDNDNWIYRIVVLSLGITILLIITGVIILMMNKVITNDATVPTIFTAIGSAAIGALAGLLAPSPKKSYRRFLSQATKASCRAAAVV